MKVRAMFEAGFELNEPLTDEEVEDIMCEKVYDIVCNYDIHPYITIEREQ